MVPIAQFGSYNTSDASTGSAQVAGGASITPLVMQTSDSSTIVGTVASDQNGTLTISQSFDNTNWDGITATLSVVGGTPQQFTYSVIGPYLQLKYTNTSGTTTTYLRIFARAYGKKS